MRQEKNRGLKDYGIHTVEQLNKTALEAHGLDQSGHLYKIISDSTESLMLFEKKMILNLMKIRVSFRVKGDKDHTKLIDMLDKLVSQSQVMSS